MRTIAAMVKNDRGELLPYTCKRYTSQVEDWCAQNWPDTWNKLQALGAKIVLVEISEVDA